jgi:thiol-disulfide isomerase/thioredoxin
MGAPKTKLACLILLSLASGATLASCRVSPRTAVLGPVTCDAEKREGACRTCFKGSCCAEYKECASDAPCPCFFAHRLRERPLAEAYETCGPMPKSYQRLAYCLDAYCAVCPMEDALRRHPLVGRAAPELDADPVGGQGPRTIKEAEGKVVVVDFWATYCGPCRKAFPMYQGLVDRFPGDVAVLAVAIDEPDHVKDDKILAFARETRVRFSILRDQDHRTAARYRRPSGIPSTFVLDRSGVVRYVHLGYDDREEDRITAEVESLIGPRASAVAGEPPARR